MAKEIDDLEATAKQALKNVAAARDEPIKQFDAAVASLVKSGMTKERATRTVARQNPKLHQAMLVSYNQKRGRKGAVRHLAE